MRALLVALLLVPICAAEMQVSIDATFASDFSRMEMDAQASFSGTEAQEMRGGMDQDGDGTVSQAEVDAIKAYMEEFMMDDLAAEIGADADITIDGVAMEDLEVGDFELDGATGPATSTAAIMIGFTITLGFPPATGSTHTLRIADDGEDEEPAEGDLEMTIFAPTGYRIGSVVNLPGSAISADGRRLVLDEENMEPYMDEPYGEIVFTKAGGKGTPGLGFVAMVAVVALAGLAARAGCRSA